MKRKKPDTVRVSLDVPAGLWAFLERVTPLTQQMPKEYLEETLKQELNAILSSVDGDIINRHKVVKTFGKGSHTSAWW